MEDCPIEEMWADVINKPKQGKVFRELMNVAINNDGDIEKANTSDWIAGMEAEEGKVSNTRTKKLSCSEVVRTWSGQKKEISTHPPQECVEASKETRIIQIDHDRYHKHGSGMTRCLTGTTRSIPQSRY